MEINMKFMRSAFAAAALLFASATGHAQSFLPTTITSDANTIFRDYNTDGVPSSGAYNPQKSQIRSLFGAIGSIIISSDKTLAVPADYATVQDALAAVQNSIIDSGVTVTIAVTGRQTYTTPIQVRHPYGDRICITGTPTTTQAISAFASATGSAGGWSVKITVPSTSGIAVGDLVGVEGASGVTYADLQDGIWNVSAINSSTQLTETNTTWYSTAPPAGAVGTLRTYPTQLKFTASTGVEADHLGCLEEIALHGSLTGTAFGLFVKDPDDAIQQGTVLAGPHLGVAGFTVDGVRANYGGVIRASYVSVSNNGNNGFLTRDLAHINCQAGCVSTGNGISGLAPVQSGGNGFEAELDSSQLLEGALSVGNFEDGYLARTNSSILCDNSAPCSAIGNLTNNYETQVLGFLQNVGGVAFGAGNDSWVANGGVMLAISSTANHSGSNSYAATLGGYLNAQTSTATNQVDNGYSSSGTGTLIDATGSTVVATVGGTPYLAGDTGYLINTGAAGLTTASPTVNTGAVAPAGYIRH
jgi:hypothetical protein